jgi:hypothetical protein
MSVTADPKLLIEQFRDRREVPSNGVLNRLVMDYARVGSQMESTLVELKAQFNDDSEAWLNLARQLIAFGNSGGGIILFGLDSKNERVGLAASLTSKFDPANITQKLQRHAPKVVVPTGYVEVVQYRKRYGVLLIAQTQSLSVFDKVGNVQVGAGRQKALFQQGVVYVRAEGTTREARQSDLDQLINDRVHDGVSAFLARIERVASLPPSSELLVRSPGSNRAYVLVAGGQGVPVTLTPDQQASTVDLKEVLTPEAPLSSLDAEVVGQVRQWHADTVHRVPRATLMRWYLGRATFTPITDRAKFCFLSALHDWGYPMYWASQMDRSELEHVICEQIESRAYPDNQVLVYVIGAFFFSRRIELLARLHAFLPPHSDQICQRLREASDVRSYLTSGRSSASARIGNTEYRMDELMAERTTTAQTLFEDLMAYYFEGNVPNSRRNVAHQLDMLVHGDLS